MKQLETINTFEMYEDELYFLMNTSQCDICLDKKHDRFKLINNYHKCNINICVGCLYILNKQNYSEI